jgi:hypothetical protein
MGQVRGIQPELLGVGGGPPWLRAAWVRGLEKGAERREKGDGGKGCQKHDSLRKEAAATMAGVLGLTGSPDHHLHWAGW